MINDSGFQASADRQVERGRDAGYSAEIPQGIQDMLDALDRQAALVDCEGIIRSINCHWRRATRRQRPVGLGPGESYTDFLISLIDRGDRGIGIIHRAIREICQGERWQFSTVYTGWGIFAGHVFKVTASRMHFDRERFAFVTVLDVTTRLGREILTHQEELALSPIQTSAA